jgi:LuxR family transcriptional regulator, regulator of acetate metabolism
MSGDPDTAALRLEDFRGLSAAAERVVGLLDSSVIAQRAAQEASRVLGREFTSVALREQPSLLVMRGAWQTRTDQVRQLRIPVGDGIGGKILLVQKPLPAAIRMDADTFSHRNEVPVHMAVIGEPFDLEPAAEAVLLAVV